MSARARIRPRRLGVPREQMVRAQVCTVDTAGITAAATAAALASEAGVRRVGRVDVRRYRGRQLPGVLEFLETLGGDPEGHRARRDALLELGVEHAVLVVAAVEVLQVKA